MGYLEAPLASLVYCQELFLHDPIDGMTTEAVMGSVQNRKHNLVHVPEAVDQCIRKQLMSADEKVVMSQAVVPHTFPSPIVAG